MRSALKAVETVTAKEEMKPRNKKPKKQKTLLHRCDFCGKSEEDVKEVVVSSKAKICDECIEICSRIVEESRLKKLVWDTLVELNKQQEAASPAAPK